MRLAELTMNDLDAFDELVLDTVKGGKPKNFLNRKENRNGSYNMFDNSFSFFLKNEQKFI
jgi:hypothetical protein